MMMSEHFEENVRFVQDWVSAMQTLCPAEQVEDFEWIIEVLSAAVRALQVQRASGSNSELGEAPNYCKGSREKKSQNASESSNQDIKL